MNATSCLIIHFLWYRYIFIFIMTLKFHLRTVFPYQTVLPPIVGRLRPGMGPRVPEDVHGSLTSSMAYHYCVFHSYQYLLIPLTIPVSIIVKLSSHISKNIFHCQAKISVVMSPVHFSHLPPYNL